MIVEVALLLYIHTSPIQHPPPLSTSNQPFLGWAEIYAPSDALQHGTTETKSCEAGKSEKVQADQTFLQGMIRNP